MPFFAVTYTYTDDTELLDRVRPDHRAFLARLVETGELFASGPCPGTTPATALLVLRTSSAERVAETLDQDPFAGAGAIVTRDIRAWDPLVGQLANLR